MRTIALDTGRYAALLTAKLPRPIRSKRGLERAERELLELDERDAQLAPEEREYAEMLAILVSDYEDRHFPMPVVAPHQSLKSLMEERGLCHKDIVDIIGNKGLTTEILAGRREVSKAMAKRLSEALRVPVGLFL